jgi:pyridoxal phosphate enzyme (YggS family)
MSSLVENLRKIEENIGFACRKGGRQRQEIQVMAVTKSQAAEKIREAAACGLGLFGENRVQEAEDKLKDLKFLGQWHLIGHLQTNKASKACEIFDAIDSVDSLKLGETLSTWCQRQGRSLRMMAEVNAGGEEQKHGFSRAQAYEEISRLAALPGLRLEGLMTMAPWTADEDLLRRTFAGLRGLRDRLRPDWGELQLSMGMSNDYQVAVEEGATVLRIGRALFA